MHTDDNIVWHSHSVSQRQRSELMGHQPCVLWYTGLSGAGKSTVANAVDLLLHQRGYHSYLLDGDNIRHGLNGDLGFSDRDRVENIRRIGETAKLFVDAGLIVSTAFISPFVADRQMVRQLVGSPAFVEIFVDAPLDLCERRDPKGLYKKARQGGIGNFTGIDSPYEPPLAPDIHIDTLLQTVEQAASQVVDYLERRRLIPG